MAVCVSFLLINIFGFVILFVNIFLINPFGWVDISVVDIVLVEVVTSGWMVDGLKVDDRMVTEDVKIFSQMTAVRGWMMGFFKPVMEEKRIRGFIQ